ncbi:MAG: hypothetical protein GKR91_08535 [Pseudomonadales bacterium]|nr:hypothetical protein [Pseudomonadales bacterium]
MVAKKKKSVRKKTKAAPKRKPASHDVYKLVSIIWEQFARGAELPIDHKCFDRVVKLGAVKNIRANLSSLSAYGKTFENAKDCSLRAGRKAKALAIAAKPKKKSIDPDTCEEAFKWVSSSYSRAGRRGGKVKPMTLVC